MTKPNNFILTTDYGTLKNDSGTTTLSVTIPNGTIFNPSNPVLGVQDAAVGTKNAPIRARSHTTKNPGVWSVGTFLYTEYNYTAVGLPGTYTGNLYCSLYRPSPGAIRLQVVTEGVTGSPNYTVVGSVTITFSFTTFLSPID